MTKVAVILVLVLLAPAQLVQPTGSGSYPPPVSGDWDITVNTTVTDEVLNIAGNLTVLNGTLALRNVTLNLAGNLIVFNGSLTLENVTVRGNLSAGWFDINVTENGSLVARNSTLSVGNCYSLNFELRGRCEFENCDILQEGGAIWMAAGGSNLSMRNCIVEATLGFWGGSPVLDGTLFRNVFNGVMFGYGTYIGNATFENCTTGVFAGSNSTVYGCVFRNCPTGITLRNNTVVKYCWFFNCSLGTSAGSGAMTAFNTSILSCLFRDCTIGASCGPRATVGASPPSLPCEFNNCSVGVEVLFDADITADFFDCNQGVVGEPGSSPNITDCFFHENDQCVNLKEVSSSTITKSRFQLPGEGGDARCGINWSRSNLTVYDCWFYSGAYNYCINGDGGNLSVSNTDLGDCQLSIRALNLTKGVISHCIFSTYNGYPGQNSSSSVMCGGDIEFRDCSISGGYWLSEHHLLEVVNGTCRGHNFIFNKTRAYVNSSAKLELYWYLNSTVNSMGGTPAPGATINITDALGKRAYELLTDANGRAPTVEVNELVNNESDEHHLLNLTPYWVNASIDGQVEDLHIKINRDMNLTIALSDATLPWIRIDTPANGSLLNTSSVELAGQAGDAAGLAELWARADSGVWPPVAFNGSGNTCDWRTTLNVSDGWHTLEVHAWDRAGNWASAHVEVLVDTIAPFLNVSSPKPVTLVNRSRLFITGSTEPGCYIEINGETVPVISGNFSWDIVLEEGLNEVRIVARDAAGNTNSTTCLVTLDTLPPALTLSFPSDGFITNDSLLILSGTVEADAKLILGSQQYNSTGSFFSISYALVEGENQLRLYAEDTAGNRNQTSRRIVLDTLPPSLTVDTVNGTSTDQASLRVSGWTESGVAVTVNGQPVAVGADGHFIANISLNAGNNTISIFSRDAAGNTASLTRTVIRVTPKPPKPPPVPDGNNTSKLMLPLIVGIVVAVGLVMGIYIALATRGRMARMRERTREYRTIGMKPAAAARQAYDDEFAAEPSLPASQKGEYECLECGAKVRAGDLKCPECGSEDVAAAMAGKKTIECPLCGARVPEDTTKCSECGAQFEQEG